MYTTWRFPQIPPSEGREGVDFGDSLLGAGMRDQQVWPEWDFSYKNERRLKTDKAS